MNPTNFYGRKVVGAAFSVLFVVYSIQFSFGTFVDDIATDTGWSETRLQLIFAIYIFTYSALSAVTGVFTDRFGPRRVVAIGAVLLTAGYTIWASAPNIWVAFLGLGVIAPLGMSASWVPCNATVVRWFVERRGTALAIATSGTSMANIVAPPIAATLVKAYGWRTTLASFALAGGAVMLMSSIWFRRDPESVGQHPDGKARRHRRADGELAEGLTAQQATRTVTYWLILCMYALTFLVVFVPFVHSNQFAVDLGVESVTAATVISSIGVGGLVGRLLVGPLSDRFGRKQLVIAAFGLLRRWRSLASLRRRAWRFCTRRRSSSDSPMAPPSPCCQRWSATTSGAIMQARSSAASLAPPGRLPRLDPMSLSCWSIPPGATGSRSCSQGSPTLQRSSWRCGFRQRVS